MHKHLFMKGYIHIYTGNGKGKTTAAFGLAIRAFGAGKKVFIGQFVKGQVYSEVKALKKISPNIEIRQYGLECFIKHEPKPADIEMAQKGLAEVAKIIKSKKYDVIILDEINIALYYKLFPIEEVIHILQNKPSESEIIITGRYAPQALIEMADLVTEMKEVKHYYTRGILAREGIEH